MFNEFVNNIYTVTDDIIRALFFALNSQHIGFVFTSFIFGFLIYLWRKRSLGKVIRNTKRYLLAKRFQQELIKDIQYIPVRIIGKVILLVTIGVSASKFRKTMEGFTDYIFPISWSALNLDPILGPAFQIITVVIILDLGEFIAHIIGHKIENLWFFHRLHHRATSLNSLTKVRMHPLEDYWTGIVRLMVAAPLFYIFKKAYNIPTVPYYIEMQLVIIGLLYFGLNHLRHSHVRIYYPRWLSYILISPVMHQVHHSYKSEHLNKNFGVIFSFWDYFAGTLYIPKKNEYFKFGIAEERNQILSVWQEIVSPFVELYRKYISHPKLKVKKNILDNYR